MMGHRVDFNSQFVSEKCRKVRWVNTPESNSQNLGTFLTGSWDNGSENGVKLWRIETENSEHDTDAVRPNLNFRLLSSFSTASSSVSEIKALKNDTFLFSTTSGDLVLLRLNNVTGCLLEGGRWKSIHTIGALPASLTSFSIFGQEVVTCGEDGKLRKVDMKTQSLIRSKESADTGSGSIYSIEHFSENQVVTGSSGAQLQLWDLRIPDKDHPEIRVTIPVESPRGNAVTSIDIHPAQSHLAVGGTQLGSLAFVDLRNPSTPPASLIPAHSGPVWEVCFHPSYPENLFTCSDDGSLLHWNATNLKQGTLRSVEECHHLSPWMLGEALEKKVLVTNLNPDQLLPINSLDIATDSIISVSDSETVDLISGLILS